MLDVRTWVYERLIDNGYVSALVGTRIYSDLGETPDQKPFIVIRCDVSNPDIPETMFQDVVLWVEDDPGSYLTIDQILGHIRDDMDGAQVVAPDGVQAIWQGDSLDLADDTRGTILRTGSYRLVGRR